MACLVENRQAVNSVLSRVLIDGVCDMLRKIQDHIVEYHNVMGGTKTE